MPMTTEMRFRVGTGSGRRTYLEGKIEKIAINEHCLRKSLVWEGEFNREVEQSGG